MNNESNQPLLPIQERQFTTKSSNPPYKCDVSPEEEETVIIIRFDMLSIYYYGAYISMVWFECCDFCFETTFCEYDPFNVYQPTQWVCERAHSLVDVANFIIGLGDSIDFDMSGSRERKDGR